MTGELSQVSQWCRITETGLDILREPSQSEWVEVGSQLASNARSLQWLIGDWVIAGESSGYLPRGTLDDACEKFGLPYSTVATAASVSRHIESSRRRELLSWGHHRQVIGRDDADELLEWCISVGASEKQLRQEKKRRDLQREAMSRPGAVQASGDSESGHQWSFTIGDCRDLPFEDDSFDLVFCSPPYESQREYSEVGFSLYGDEFVQWAADCYMECLRVCRGLVAWVIEGFTENYEYSASPFLLMSELKRRGAKLRKPVVYKRNGIPGTGGPDWLRNDWEPIVCATKNGKLPWSDNTAMGSVPKQNKPRQATNRNRDGTRKEATYYDPEICNPGNVIEGLVGSGGLGWPDAHINEAPFPEWLAEFFVRSFCPPGGRVLDPFSGSGTTVAVAVRHGRHGTGVDLRESQVWLGETRLMGLTVSQRKQGQGLLI